MSLPPTCPPISLSVDPKPGNFSPSCTSPPLGRVPSVPESTDGIQAFLRRLFCPDPSTSTMDPLKNYFIKTKWKVSFFNPNGRAVPLVKTFRLWNMYLVLITSKQDSKRGPRTVSYDQGCHACILMKFCLNACSFSLTTGDLRCQLIFYLLAFVIGKDCHKFSSLGLC